MYKLRVTFLTELLILQAALGHGGHYLISSLRKLEKKSIHMANFPPTPSRVRGKVFLPRRFSQKSVISTLPQLFEGVKWGNARRGDEWSEFNVMWGLRDVTSLEVEDVSRAHRDYAS